MAAEKILNSTSLSIEVRSGVDSKGVDTYAKKSFPNLRNDVVEQNAYDVAEAIKTVLEAGTRNTSLTVSSDLVKA